MSLFQLIFTFFYIGLFTIGGGIVALTIMQQTLVNPGIISQEQFYNMVAISESTPGPLGTNMATYIGYNLYGIPGGIIATLSEAAPSVIIILIIAHFMKKFPKPEKLQQKQLKKLKLLFQMQVCLLMRLKIKLLVKNQLKLLDVFSFINLVKLSES